MHLLAWYSNPRGRNDYPASLLDEEPEGGDGCHLPKVTQVVRGVNPVPPESHYRTVLRKRFKCRWESCLSSLGSTSRCKAGTHQLVLAAVRVLPLTTYGMPHPGGSHAHAWCTLWVSKAVDLSSMREILPDLGPSYPQDRKCFFIFFPQVFDSGC